MYLLKVEFLKESAYREQYKQLGAMDKGLSGQRGEDGWEEPSPWSCGVGKGFVGLKCKNPSVKEGAYTEMKRKGLHGNT